MSLPEQNESNLTVEKESLPSTQQWGEERSKKARLENLEKARKAKMLKTQNFSIEALSKSPIVQDIPKPIIQENVNYNAWYYKVFASIFEFAVTAIIGASVTYAASYFTVPSAPSNSIVPDDKENKVKSIYSDNMIFK